MSDALIGLGVLTAYVVLQVWLLPRLGVPS